MLTPDQMSALQDALEKIAEPVTDFIVRDVVRRISEAGKMTRTAEYQLKQAIWLKKSKKDINTLLGKINASETIANTFSTALEAAVAQDDIAKALEDDEDLQNILNAAVKLAQDDFTNITQTLGLIDPFGNPRPLRDAYISCTDYAFKKVLTGAQSYQQAVYEAANNLIDKGVRVIDYESGVHTSVDAAVRRNVFGGMGLMVEQVETHIHEELGATGWELSAHEACALDHEPYQGRQYTNAEYEALNGTAENPGTLKRRIGTLNCKHVAFPVMIGIQKPIYSEEQLKKMEERNRKGITFEGKHYTMYEATQMQRSLERAIRKQRRKIAALEEMDGQDEKLKAARIRYTQLTQKYKEFSKAAGLRTQDARTLVKEFGPKQEKVAWNEAEDNYQEWAKSMGVNSAIPTLDEYYDIKYNNLPLYELLKGYITAIDKGDISPLVGFDQYELIDKEVTTKLHGLTTVDGVTIEKHCSHFIDRVIGQTSESHPGMRTGVPIDDVKDILLNANDIRTEQHPSGDIRRLYIGEKGKVSISVRDKLLIQTNP